MSQNTPESGLGWCRASAITHRHIPFHSPEPQATNVATATGGRSGSTASRLRERLRDAGEEGAEGEAQRDEAGLEDGFEAVRRAHQPRHQPLGERLGRKVHADHQRASQVEGLCLVGPDLANLPKFVARHILFVSVVDEAEAAHVCDEAGGRGGARSHPWHERQKEHCRKHLLGVVEAGRRDELPKEDEDRHPRHFALHRPLVPRRVRHLGPHLSAQPPPHDLVDHALHCVV
mmetsp:Transcript_39657/g.128930  ORF Transcript_39657/g.128930 Transcript_39657/m.128930 type:complete len:232 (-) Transcript_39657:297-992(-)